MPDTETMPNDTETMPNDAETTNDKTTYETLLEAIYSEDPNFKTQEEGESDRDYLIRFMENVASTPPPTFDRLPDEVQEWFNHTANAMMADANAVVEMPQGFVSVYDEGATAPKADKKKRGRPSGSTATNTKAETKAEVKTKAKKPPGSSATTIIREAVVANPGSTAEQINEVLVGAGFKNVEKSTIMTTRHSALGTLRAAQKAGLLNVDLDLPA